MDIVELGKALSNQTRVHIILLLAGSPSSTASLHQKYTTKYDESKHRETIYREVEKLVEIGLVDKNYDSNSKTFIYTLNYESIEIDLLEGEVQSTSDFEY